MEDEWIVRSQQDAPLAILYPRSSILVCFIAPAGSQPRATSRGRGWPASGPGPLGGPGCSAFWPPERGARWSTITTSSGRSSSREAGVFRLRDRRGRHGGVGGDRERRSRGWLSGHGLLGRGFSVPRWPASPGRAACTAPPRRGSRLIASRVLVGARRDPGGYRLGGPGRAGWGDATGRRTTVGAAGRVVALGDRSAAASPGGRPCVRVRPPRRAARSEGRLCGWSGRDRLAASPPRVPVSRGRPSRLAAGVCRRGRPGRALERRGGSGGRHGRYRGRGSLGGRVVLPARATCALLVLLVSLAAAPPAKLRVAVRRRRPTGPASGC